MFMTREVYRRTIALVGTTVSGFFAKVLDFVQEAFERRVKQIKANNLFK